MGEGTRTVSQHDARRQEDGTITIFDNGAPTEVHDQSRGIAVELDMDAMRPPWCERTPILESRSPRPRAIYKCSPNGNVFVGWGTEPFISEYSKDGKLLFASSSRARTQS
jgi:hypothetical protein